MINKSELVNRLIIQYRKNPQRGTLYIVDTGDPSRYHEIIALQYGFDGWQIIEDYLYPEARFFRKTNVIINESELSIWLISFIDCYENEIINGKIDIEHGLNNIEQFS